MRRKRIQMETAKVGKVICPIPKNRVKKFDLNWQRKGDNYVDGISFIRLDLAY
jgi:hypothetical protein